MNEQTVGACDALAEELSRIYISGINAADFTPESFVEKFLEVRKEMRVELLMRAGLEEYTYDD